MFTKSQKDRIHTFIYRNEFISESPWKEIHKATKEDSLNREQCNRLARSIKMHDHGPNYSGDALRDVLEILEMVDYEVYFRQLFINEYAMKAANIEQWLNSDDAIGASEKRINEARKDMDQYKAAIELLNRGSK
jgi:hypothetical protein